MLWNIFSDLVDSEIQYLNFELVLILIVMEYLLWQVYTIFQLRGLVFCLNPYCYGISSLTYAETYSFGWGYCVLILIVMEYLLWPNNRCVNWDIWWCLNPYCYGISSLTVKKDANVIAWGSRLNPYCYGISSLTPMKWLL